MYVVIEKICSSGGSVLYFPHAFIKKASSRLITFDLTCMLQQILHDNLICHRTILLFISYKFVKGFLAITFLLLAFSNWNFHDVCQRFLYNQEQNFSWIRQKTKIFPIHPIIKIAHFCNVMSMDMTLQKWAIFIMGVYGEISHFLSDSTEILFLVI